MKDKRTLHSSEQVKIIQTLISNYLSIYNEWNSVQLLIKNFDLQKYHQKKKEQTESVQRLIEDFRNSKLYHKTTQYDLFRVLNFKPSENNISDVIASIINPKKSPWGKDILIALLNEGKKNHKLEVNFENVIQLVKKTPNKRFFIKREWRGDLSRIDIRVTTRNPYPEENIVIDLEMKTGNGSETFSNEMYQTEREWKDLQKFREKLKIPYKNIIAFYISPLEFKPKCKYFIPISGYQLNEYILNIMKNTPTTDIYAFEEESIWAIRHFFTSNWVF